MIQIPIWVIQLIVPLLWVVLTGLMIYTWKKLEKRVDDLESTGESALKKQAETGQPMTLPEHDKICRGNLEGISKEFNEMLKLQESKVNDKIDSLQEKLCLRIDSFEQKIILLIENKILTSIKPGTPRRRKAKK